MGDLGSLGESEEEARGDVGEEDREGEGGEEEGGVEEGRVIDSSVAYFSRVGERDFVLEKVILSKVGERVFCAFLLSALSFLSCLLSVLSFLFSVEEDFSKERVSGSRSKSFCANLLL